MAWDVMDVDFSSFRLLLSSPVGSAAMLCNHTSLALSVCHWLSLSR